MIEDDRDTDEAAQAWKVRVETVLVPIDFSPFSSKALRYAVAFAEQFGARLVLVTVLETPMPVYDMDYMSSSMVEWYEQAKNQTAEKLRTFADKTIDGSLHYVCFARSGEPTQEILLLAAEEQADLIIMGTHGRTGLKHMILGSVAEKTVRSASCPVLVVRLAQREFAFDTAAGPRLEMLEIIAPLDFSDGASHALHWAESLADKTGARLNLLHVVPFHYAVGEYDALQYPELETELTDAAKERLAAIEKEEHGHGIEAQAAVLTGSPRDQILEFARKEKGDLIVMGTRGLTGIKHLVLGSTAEYVIRHASCAVLTVPFGKMDHSHQKRAEPHVATV